MWAISFVSAKNSVYIVSSVYWTPGRSRATPNWALGNYKERKEQHSLLWRAYSLMGRLRWQIPSPGDERHHRGHQLCLQLYQGADACFCFGKGRREVLIGGIAIVKWKFLSRVYDFGVLFPRDQIESCVPRTHTPPPLGFEKRERV